MLWSRMFQCCWHAHQVTVMVYIERVRRLLPESVVWLCANNRVAEAEQLIRNAAKMNNITMPDKILANSLTIEIIDITDDDVNRKGGKSVKKFSQSENLKSERITDRSSRYTIIDIFRNRRLTINVLCMMLLWSVISYVCWHFHLLYLERNVPEVCHREHCEHSNYTVVTILRWARTIFIARQHANLLVILPYSTAENIFDEIFKSFVWFTNGDS